MAMCLTKAELWTCGKITFILSKVNVFDMTLFQNIATSLKTVAQHFNSNCVENAVECW